MTVQFRHIASLSDDYDMKHKVWIESKGDKDFVKKLMFKRLITSGCGKGATFYFRL